MTTVIASEQHKELVKPSHNCICANTFKQKNALIYLNVNAVLKI